MAQLISDGQVAWSFSHPNASLSTEPGPRLWMKTSALASSAHMSLVPAGVLRSISTLRHVRQHQVVVDRRDFVEACLAELALDVVLGGKAIAAVGIDARVGGFPGRVGGKQLCHVRLGPTWLACVK